MESAHLCRKQVVAERGTDIVEFVGDYGHSYAGTADKYAPISLASGNCLGHLFTEVGVIYGLRGVGTVISVFMTQIHEEIEDIFFQVETCVIGTDSNKHDLDSPFVSSRCVKTASKMKTMFILSKTEKPSQDKEQSAKKVILK
jgi:hypothetical protein